MCYDTGALQAFLDGEVAGGEQSAIEKHLTGCSSCRETLDQLRENQTFTDARVAGYLRSLSRTGIDTGGVWLQSNNSRRPRQNNYGFKKGVFQMLSKYRVAATAAVMVLAVAIAFSFSSVRSVAGELLTIFRVEKVKTISIAPADLANIEKAVRSGAGQVDIENFGKLEFVGKQTASKVSLEEARDAVDFQLKLPEPPPAGYRLQEVSLNSGGTLNLTLNTDNTNQVLKSLGSEKLLPDELNGKMFSVKVPATVSTRYAGSGDASIFVMEGRSPELAANGADVSAIRDALLALPFLPESLRGQIASVNDWQHTLLVPVVDGTTRDVNVAGSQGVFITPPADVKGGGNDSPPNSLIWQKDGVVYAISGKLTLEQAMDMAVSMK
ncbi:zf-HC2 domain-containing protein [Pelotomaculum isophthalicicum JI]|uniref:Anti-sigma-W factor RsiW n=1 Tax=Pelotomaculum isophthalicicum JI TaxID=947010 RepID=A0A9X4H4W4_9FIRM|nr:zf-HC2 domain-containing protein [Pelotomaculum isophthalicicum]MDF9407952.1 zf-HC2 domain-containing protein [Pelotomaculum isophthalicicum JI]